MEQANHPVIVKSSLHPDQLPSRPSILPEKKWAKLQRVQYVAGIDEAGRGPLAGPVVAAAVVFSFQKKRPAGLNDSKKLSEPDRNRLFVEIQKSALAYGIGEASPHEIDQINILEATRLASLRALEICSAKLKERLGCGVEALVTDALTFSTLSLPQFAMTKGDARSVSVAAASILAKVTRDRIMVELDRQHPGYGLAGHKGYPTKKHYEAIQNLGATPCHRLSFRGVKT